MTTKKNVIAIWAANYTMGADQKEELAKLANMAISLSDIDEILHNGIMSMPENTDYVDLATELLNVVLNVRIPNRLLGLNEPNILLIQPAGNQKFQFTLGKLMNDPKYNRINVLYAYNKRISYDVIENSKTIKKSTFKHIRFE